MANVLLSVAPTVRIIQVVSTARLTRLSGAIAVYDISTALRTRNLDGGVLILVYISEITCSDCAIGLFPTHYLVNHQSGVRAISWIRAPGTTPDGTPLTSEDPTVIASGGYDGVECITDIRELVGNIMNRTRGL